MTRWPAAAQRARFCWRQFVTCSLNDYSHSKMMTTTNNLLFSYVYHQINICFNSHVPPPSVDWLLRKWLNKFKFEINFLHYLFLNNYITIKKLNKRIILRSNSNYAGQYFPKTDFLSKTNRNYGSSSSNITNYVQLRNKRE